MKNLLLKPTIVFLLITNLAFCLEKPIYTIVDTGQSNYYNNYSQSSKPQINSSFYGQDSTYLGFQQNYTNNNDGTVSDNNTQLIWQKAISDKLTWNEAVDYANSSNLAGHKDWRIPTIKELYSLIDFTGVTGTSRNKGTTVPTNAKPYINRSYFDFEYSPTNRYIDAQYWTQTDYVSTTMKGSKTFFGVNFADGRIKGYPKYNKGRFGSTKFYLRLVRGNKNYGKNEFIDKNDGTIYDNATQLTWMKYDSANNVFENFNLNGALNWEKALEFCESSNYANNDSWRLPNAKELQSIVDYTKSPDTTGSAAINEVFESTPIKNKNEQIDYAFYWTSTTHLDGHQMGNSAVYIAFGRAMGYMNDRRTNSKELMDVHGAGAQRSDPKSGDASRFQYGRGPQGDVISIDNYVRCVRDDNTVLNQSNSSFDLDHDVMPKIDNKTNRFKQSQVSNNSKHSNMVLKRFDKNRDNRISYNEAPRRMRDNFARHDNNSDGYLDESELKTLPKPR